MLMQGKGGEDAETSNVQCVIVIVDKGKGEKCCKWMEEEREEGRRRAPALRDWVGYSPLLVLGPASDTQQAGSTSTRPILFIRGVCIRLPVTSSWTMSRGG